MHLSNSSYAKILDYARMGHLYRIFPRILSDGSAIALGGSAYTFHREIPFMAKYEIHIGIYSWDNKWLCECLCSLGDELRCSF